RVHVVGEVLPHAADALHLGLPTEFSFRTHFARDTRHFGGEAVELVDHRVDRALEGEDLALDVHRDLLRQVALRHCGGDFGDVAHLAGEVRGHRVHVVGEVLPDARDALHLRLPAELSVGPDLPRHPGDFTRESIELIDHRVDGALQLEDLALDVDGDLLRQVALGDGGRHLGDVPH